MNVCTLSFNIQYYVCHVSYSRKIIDWQNNFIAQRNVSDKEVLSLLSPKICVVMEAGNILHNLLPNFIIIILNRQIVS